LSAPQKARAIGFKLHIVQGFAFDNDQMRHPGLRIAVRTPPPRGEDRTETRYELRFHEQFREGGMSHIVGLPRQSDFRI
jgi:hypothetical protein